MRTQSLAVSLASLILSLAGCATTAPEVRTAEDPRVRTLTAIGDRPIAVASGDPGSQEASIIPRALPDREPDREVAGRVVDAKGSPVPNAEVRVAIGNSTAGRDERVFTDELGRFTLHDLREGSDYSIVAEWPDGRGGYLSGRSRATVPARQVEIALSPPGRNIGAAVSNSSVGRVSQREEMLVDEPGYGEPPYQARTPNRVNDEDLPLPEEAETLLSGRESGFEIEPSDSDIAWRRRDNAERSARAGAAALGTTTGDDVPYPQEPEPFDEYNPLPPAREQPIGFKPPISQPAANYGLNMNMQPVEPMTGDGPPLSGPEGSGTSLRPAPEPIRSSDPASERLIEKTFAGSPEPEFPSIPATGSTPPPPDQAVPETADRTEVIPPQGTPEIQAEPAQPEALEPTEVFEPSAPLVTSADETAAELPTQAVDAPVEFPAPDLGFAPPQFPLDPIENEGLPPGPTPPTPPLGLDDSSDPGPDSLTPPSLEEGLPPSPEAPVDEPITQAPAKKWSWSELARATGTTTNDPLAIAASVSAAAAATRAPLSPAPPAAGPPSLVATEEVVADNQLTDPQVLPASCSFNKKERRLVDFEMTDVNGKRFRFTDIDSDYILLDFWGTWCGPCVRSIPHLVDLQSRFGADKLKIIGVAYEQGGFSERAATVKTVARRLGINYDVLIGEADGQPCPLQAALNVQVYPTLVLLDRQGRIVWRDQGATTTTLGRLDRVIAVNLSGQTLRR